MWSKGSSIRKCYTWIFLLQRFPYVFTFVIFDSIIYVRHLWFNYWRSSSFANHGHGHGHGIFILATHPEGKWYWNSHNHWRPLLTSATCLYTYIYIYSCVYTYTSTSQYTNIGTNTFTYTKSWRKMILRFPQSWTSVAHLSNVSLFFSFVLKLCP
jgi:hypothetical protein